MSLYNTSIPEELVDDPVDGCPSFAAIMNEEICTECEAIDNKNANRKDNVDADGNVNFQCVANGLQVCCFSLCFFLNYKFYAI